MNELLTQFEERGMKVERSLFDKLEIKKIFKTEEDTNEKLMSKFIVSRHHQDGTSESLEEYDQVFNCIGRYQSVDNLKIEENRPKVQIYRRSTNSSSSKESPSRIIGRFNSVLEWTSDPQIFAVGDILHDSGKNNPSADQGGKRAANLIADLIKAQKEQPALSQTEELCPSDSISLPESVLAGVLSPHQHKLYSPMPCTLFTSPCLSGVGLSQETATERLGRERVGKVVVQRKALLDDYKHTLRPSQYACKSMYKVVYDKQTRRILGVHHLGEGGPELVYGLSTLFASPNKDNNSDDFASTWTVDDLTSLFTVHPSFGEGFKYCNIEEGSEDVKNIDAC